MEADLTWLAGAFGFEAVSRPMSFGPYHVLEVDGESRGGVMPAEGPSAFLTWVHVADLDGTVQRLEARGGACVSPRFGDDEVGAMIVVADPAGAVFGLVQPS